MTIFTYSVEQSHSWEFNWFSASQEISWRFITTFPTACHLSLSWARSVQSIIPHATSWRSILILSFHQCLVLRSGSSLQVPPPPKSCIHLSSPPYILYASPISFFSILSPKQYWVNTAHWASHYLVFSTPFCLGPLRLKYSPQHPILKHLQPIYVPPEMWVTKFHTHTKQQAKL